MQVVEQIRSAASYTAAERRVADYCVQTYPKLAFATVASVAEASGTSAPTVMRFAAKAGFSGFSELQHHVRQSLESDWRPALDRLDRHHVAQSDTWPERRLRADIEHLERTYHNLSPVVFDDIVGLLADETRPIYLAGGEITHGLCLSFGALLSWLRDDVHVLGTVAARYATELARMSPRSIVLVLHLRRFTRLMSEVIETACAIGCQVIVGTNSPTLRLPERVRQVVVLHLQGENEILDSYTAIASVMNSFATALAERQRTTLRGRLDGLEEQWRKMGVYVDESDREPRP
jgi:DNA-binding MurR/RpiR family transcriptional regulator